MNTKILPLGRVDARRVGKITPTRMYRADGDKLGGLLVNRATPSTLLRDFRKVIDDGSDEAIVRFARQWGLLGLCKHGLPPDHRGSTRCSVRHFDEKAHYKAFGDCIESLRRIGIALKSGDPGDDADWEIADLYLNEHDFSNTGRKWSGSPASKRSLLAKLGIVLQGRDMAESVRTGFSALMCRLIVMCDLQPRFYWSPRAGAWNIDLDVNRRGANLPAILASQLMLEIAGSKSTRKCATCPRWFIPNRKQKYCDSCGTQAAWREAARRQREGTAKPRTKSTLGETLGSRDEKARQMAN